MKKTLLVIAFCSCGFPLSMHQRAEAATQPSHWYYCNGAEIQNDKNTYYSTTFSSSTDSGTLFRDFSNYVSQHYDVPVNGLTGVCYGARPYKSDTFQGVEDQRSQDMTQSSKHGKNVIPTGWAGQ
jgi:hypothetical protein